MKTRSAHTRPRSERVQRLARAACLAAVLFAAPVAAQGPLEEFARLIPADVTGRIVLTDVEASAAEADALTSEFDWRNRSAMIYTPLTLIDGFDHFAAYEAMVPDGLAPLLGVRMDLFRRMASWQAGSDAPVIIEFRGAPQDDIRAVLDKRGFQRQARFGTDTWAAGEDLTPDPARAFADPFAQQPGYPARFAFSDERLVFARSWAGLETLLSGPAGLDTVPDAAALLRAGYGVTGRGRLLEAIVLGPQINRRQAVSGFIGDGPGAAAKIAEILRDPGFRTPPMPAFSRHALLVWQDGQRMSGAIALAYPDRQTAEKALAGFRPLTDTILSLFAKAPFTGLFPYEWWSDVIETEHGVVALIGFEEDRTGEPLVPMFFITNPYDRLRDMMLTGDLALLLAGE